MQIITEIVSMKLVSGITKDEFISIVDGLEHYYHSKQSGFIDSELLYNEQDDVWIMIQHWESTEQLKAASKKMFTESSAESFVKSLSRESVKMTILPQLKAWR